MQHFIVHVAHPMNFFFVAVGDNEVSVHAPSEGVAIFKSTVYGLVHVSGHVTPLTQTLLFILDIH